MTPAQIIAPFLIAANNQRPDLAQTNTIVSCMELIHLTIQRANDANPVPAWAYVGKSSAMDGGMARPAWFTPVSLSLQRPDGQMQGVLIDGLSMDSLWYLPTMTQVKVIAFSTANEPGDWEHGPAKLTPYDIDEFKNGARQYRWHNPPIAAAPGAVEHPAPTPTPTPHGILSKEQAFEAMKWLDGIYRTELLRPEGLGGDMEAVAQWFFSLVIEGESRESVLAKIKSSDEWKSKHQ